MDVIDEENIEWLMESSKTVENSGQDSDVANDGEQTEAYHFHQVLRSVFESEPSLAGSKAKGIVNSDEDLQKLLKRLKALGYFFSIRSSDKKMDKQNCKIMIANKKGNSSSHPYIVRSHIHYSCSHRNKQGHKSTELNHTKPMRKYTSCKATMDIRQVEIFTNVCLASVRRKRIEMLKKFRHNLATNSTDPGVLKYSVIISLPNAHNHSINVRGQYLSDEVKAAMHSILQSGVTSLPDIQEKLYQIVDQEFRNDSIKPSRENSAFYPNQKTIYNHLRHDGLDRKKKMKKRSETTDLKRKIFDDLRCIYDEVNKCTDHEKLKKFHLLITNVRQ